MDDITVFHVNAGYRPTLTSGHDGNTLFRFDIPLCCDHYISPNHRACHNSSYYACGNRPDDYLARRMRRFFNDFNHFRQEIIINAIGIIRMACKISVPCTHTGTPVSAPMTVLKHSAHFPSTLELMQSPVQTMGCKQTLGRVVLFDMSTVDNHDSVSLLDC